jgi:DNA-binding transcriptional regulator PaaX
MKMLRGNREEKTIKNAGVRLVEALADKKHRREDVTKALLAGIATVGVLALAATAPNAVQLLKFFPGMNSRKRYTALSAFGRLLDRGHLELVSRNGKKFARLTEKGRKQLRLYDTHGVSSEKIWRRWDGRWRIVSYDIPEKRKHARKLLLAALRRHGFYKLQASVWVHPYDCEEFITLIKTDIGEGKGVIYGVLSALENDKRVREHFKLPLDR